MSEEESGYLTQAKGYFTLNQWQLLIVLGVAISGIAAFVTAYDALFKIDSKVAACAESDALKKALQTRFIVVLVLSCVAIVIGIILGIVYRKNPKRVLTFGLTAFGILGILYAVITKYNKAQISIKLGISWTSFIAFIILGYLCDAGIIFKSSNGEGNDD
jgi:F0F1-type ATP synthase membrane subunit c/vacuolar-type H+-ATPase subunit K